MQVQQKEIGQDFISRTIAGLKMRNNAKSRSRSRTVFYESMIDYYEAPLKARVEGRPYGWIEIQAPVELFYAMDVPPFYPEHWSLVVASQDATIPFLEAAEQHHCKDLCSVHKVYIGALNTGELPPPQFMLGLTHPCDAVLYGMQHAAFPHKHNPCACKAQKCVAGIPIFQMDGPFWVDETAFQYYMSEIREGIAFMEKMLGRKMDYDRLKDVVNKSVEAFRIHGLNNKLVAQRPCPRHSRDIMRSAFAYNTIVGTQYAIDYLSALNQEMQERVDKGEGVVPNERIRLGWINVQAYSFMEFFDAMEKEFGAVVVTDNLGAGWLGGDGTDDQPMFPHFPDDPIRTLAARGLYHYGSTCYKDPARFINSIIRMVKNFQLDGIIFSGHWGCKNILSLVKPLREDLLEQTGVPMLVLESDCLDPRTNPLPKMMALTREFIEMLDQQKR